MGFLERLDKYDKLLFQKINQDWALPFFDWLMPIVRNQQTWYVCYLLLLGYIIYAFRKKAIPFILLAGACIAVADQLSSSVLKPLFNRIRPCHLTELHTMLRVGYCPGSGSFTSSHAVNHFALAAYLFFALKKEWGAWRWLLFVWATFICYAQVYVGVHYPGDVLGGGILGTCIGYGASILLRRKFFKAKLH
ncbi:MAG: phosphatase PAP2 family protein [Edaphocola sp.]